MEDIPVDLSNKKYFSNNEIVNSDLPSEVETPLIQERPKEPTLTVRSKHHSTRKALQIRLKVLRKWIAQKVEEFKKVQYPYLYGKFYDLYHFELVSYKPLDVTLKILIIVTILIVIGIVLIVLKELINLAF